MKYPSTIHKYFYWWNLLVLSLLGVLIRYYHTEVSLISWPVSSLLSVYLLSSCIFLIHHQLKKAAPMIASLLAFTVLHWMLTGLFDIILTRFFRLKEDYNLLVFDVYLLDHTTTMIDGLLWGISYLCLFSWFRYQQKATHIDQEKKALEKQLSSSELNLLSREINPHFLFNAMNGIAMKVRLGENRLAVKMLVSLNDLLRLSLIKEHDKLIRLEEELELLDKYLTIEHVRFGDHFSLSQEIPEEIRSLKVPMLILQPLVENAFKHGMNNNLEKMTLKIEGKVSDETLNLTVYNSQDNLSKLNFATSNVGLPNVAYRLRRFFGANFQFRSFSEKGGVAFKITMPVTE